MTKLMFGLAAAVAFLATAPAAKADDCATCGSHAPRTWGPHAHKYERFTGWFRGSSNAAPKLQAAPWYQYFPYNGQFQTPGPIGGPNAGGMVNPYFPGH